MKNNKNYQKLLECAIRELPKGQINATIDGEEVMNTNKRQDDRLDFFEQPFLTNVTYAFLDRSGDYKRFSNVFYNIQIYNDTR